MIRICEVTEMIPPEAYRLFLQSKYPMSEDRLVCFITSRRLRTTHLALDTVS